LLTSYKHVLGQVYTNRMSSVIKQMTSDIYRTIRMTLWLYDLDHVMSPVYFCCL